MRSHKNASVWLLISIQRSGFQESPWSICRLPNELLPPPTTATAKTTLPHFSNNIHCTCIEDNSWYNGPRPVSSPNAADAFQTSSFLCREIMKYGDKDAACRTERCCVITGPTKTTATVPLNLPICSKMGSMSARSEAGRLHRCYNVPYLTGGLVFSRAKTPFSHGQLAGRALWKPPVWCIGFAISRQMKGNRGALPLPHYRAVHLSELRKNGDNRSERRG